MRFLCTGCQRFAADCTPCFIDFCIMAIHSADKNLCRALMAAIRRITITASGTDVHISFSYIIVWQFWFVLNENVFAFVKIHTPVIEDSYLSACCRPTVCIRHSGPYMLKLRRFIPAEFLSAFRTENPSLSCLPTSCFPNDSFFSVLMLTFCFFRDDHITFCMTVNAGMPSQSVFRSCSCSNDCCRTPYVITFHRKRLFYDLSAVTAMFQIIASSTFIPHCGGEKIPMIRLIISSI